MKRGCNIVGRHVRRMRMEKRLSQNALAIRCQLEGWRLSRETLSKIEAGLRGVTDAEVFFLAKILECSPEVLLLGDDQEILAVLRHSRDEAGG